MSGTLSAGTVSIGVKSDSKGFGAGLHKSLMGEVGGLGKILGGAVMGGFGAAIAGIGAVVGVGMKEAMSADKINAQFAAGIKSTGNVAGLSVKTMDDLASSVAGYSGQTFESIGKTEQLLQTFRNIKNEGPNKIFDMATVSAADMAAKMGGDASGMAIKLGKALNDPVKGVGALARVGVQFTKAQKDQIAAMVKSGDTMGAQKIILGELNSEFGGAAKAAGETLPGQLARGKVAFGELSKSVMEGVLPSLTSAMSGVNDFITGTQASFRKGGLSQVFTDLGTKISAALPGIKMQLGKWGVALWAWVQDAYPPMVVKLGEMGLKIETWLYTVALPAIVTKLTEWGKAFVEWITPMIPPMFIALGGLLTRLGDWIWHTGFPLLGEKLAQWGKAFWAWIVPAIGPMLLTLGGMLLRLGGWILTVALPAIIGQLGRWGKALWGWVGPMIPPMLVELGKLLVKLGVWSYTVALPAILKHLVGWALAFAAWVPGAAVRLIVALGILQVKLGAWFVTVAIPAIVGYFASLPGRISSAASGMWDGLKTSFRSAINWIIGKWNDLQFTIGGGSVMGVTIPKVVLGTPNIPYLAAGGIVPATPGGRLVRVAEGGQDEAVVPLPKGGRGGPFGIDYERLGEAVARAVAKRPNVLDGRVMATSLDQRLAPR